MPSRPTTQIYHRSSNILRPARPPIRITLTQLLFPTASLHDYRRHLTHEKAWRYAVYQNVFWGQLDGEVAREMEDGGFGSSVGVGPGGAEGTDGEASDGAGY